MTFDPRNILVIDFGQLGDVVMSLPALRAIRERFPHARITVAVGKPGAEIMAMSGSADATIEIDRVALRDGFKPLSVLKVFQVVKDVRRRQFDFVDRPAQFCGNEPARLFQWRRRSLIRRVVPVDQLDFLASFNPKPPVDRERSEATFGRSLPRGAEAIGYQRPATRSEARHSNRR